MNYNIATILAVIAIIFVLITYITSAPACAGRSHPARAGDYFRGTRKRKFEKQLKIANFSGDRAERRDSATLSRDDLTGKSSLTISAKPIGVGAAYQTVDSSGRTILIAAA